MDLSMVSREFRVDSNMITLGERMRETDILRQFQQTGIEDMERANHGFYVMNALHEMLVIVRNNVRFYRLPEYEETVTALTCAPRYDGLFFVRYYALRDAAGGTLADACSYWTLIDSESKRIIRPGRHDDSYLPRVEAFAVTAPAPSKLNPPEDMREVGRRVVYRHETDQYGHLNNTRYVDVLSDFLPENTRMTALEMNYSRELPPGAEYSVQTDGRGFFAFVRDGAVCFSAKVETAGIEE